MDNKKKEYDNLVYLWGNTFPLLNAESAIGYTVVDDILAAKSELIFYIKGNYKVSFGKKKQLETASKFGDLFLKDSIYKEHKRKMEKLFLRREKFINEINKKSLNKLSNEQLFKYVEEYAEIFKRVFGHMVISRPECVDHLSEKLLELITNKVSDSKTANKHLSILLTEARFDIIKKEKIEKLKLHNNPIKNNLKRHILNNPWLYGYMYSMDKAIEALSKEVKKENKKKLEKEIKEFQLELKKTKKQKNNLLKKYNKTVALLSERLSFLGHNRLEVKARFAGLLVVASPLFEEISKRTGVSVKKIADNYFVDDVKNLLLNNKKVSKKEINQRNTVVLYTSGKIINYLIGKEAIRFYNRYLKKYLESKKTFVEGTVASKGIVNGKCRVMKLKENMNLGLFKKGEILITEMTAPHMVPIIGKSAGVITNEGGIMSHAAVVSREFKVPCIVGTGNATEVFNTGDYIKLDAEKGTAKKIK